MEKGWSTSQPHDTTSLLSPVISSPIHHMRCAGNPRRCPLRGRNGSGISEEKKQLPAGGLSEPVLWPRTQPMLHKQMVLEPGEGSLDAGVVNNLVQSPVAYSQSFSPIL